MRTIETVPLATIIVDRWRIVPKTLEFALAMSYGDVFPPVKVQRVDDGRYRLKDGRHRVTAAKLNGMVKVRVIVARGGRYGVHAHSESI